MMVNKDDRRPLHQDDAGGDHQDESDKGREDKGRYQQKGEQISLSPLYIYIAVFT